MTFENITPLARQSICNKHINRLFSIHKHHCKIPHSSCIVNKQIFINYYYIKLYIYYLNELFNCRG